MTTITSNSFLQRRPYLRDAYKDAWDACGCKESQVESNRCEDFIELMPCRRHDQCRWNEKAVSRLCGVGSIPH